MDEFDITLSDTPKTRRKAKLQESSSLSDNELNKKKRVNFETKFINEWTDRQDELLQSWRKQASINFWLQIASKYYYGRLNAWLAYPSIILSTATSIGVFGMGNGMGAKYITSVMALLSAILIGVSRHAQAAEKAKEFILRAKDFYILIREMDYLLATPFIEREPMKETMSRLRRTFDRIVDMALDPPIFIIRSYEKKFRPLEASLLQDLQAEMGEGTPASFMSPTHSPEKKMGPLKRMQSVFHMANMSEGRHSEAPESIHRIKSTVNSIMFSMPTGVPPTPKKYGKLVMSPYQLYTHPVTMTNPLTHRARTSIDIGDKLKSTSHKTIDLSPNSPIQIPRHRLSAPQVEIQMDKVVGRTITIPESREFDGFEHLGGKYSTNALFSRASPERTSVTSEAELVKSTSTTPQNSNSSNITKLSPNSIN